MAIVLDVLVAGVVAGGVAGGVVLAARPRGKHAGGSADANDAHVPTDAGQGLAAEPRGKAEPREKAARASSTGRTAASSAGSTAAGLPTDGTSVATSPGMVGRPDGG